MTAAPPEPIQPVGAPSLSEVPATADALSDADATDEEEPPPSPEEMAAYLGVSDGYAETDAEPFSSDQSLPDLAEAEQRIPAATKALMDELFRAKLQKVQRIDPKTIR